MARAFAVAAVLLLGLFACAQARPARGPTNIADWIQDKKAHATVFQLLKEYGLADAVGKDFNGTVFLPTEAAFEKLASVLPDLSKEQVKSILLYHVYGKNIIGPDFVKGKVIPTLLGNETLTLGKTADGINTVNQIKINKIITLGRAKIAIIDTLLLPKDLPQPKPDFPSVVAAATSVPELSNITQLVIDLGLLDAVKDFNGTLFLPINSAFEAVKGANLTEDMLRELVLYHAVPRKIKTSDWSKPATQRQFSVRGLEVNLITNDTELYAEGAKILKRVTAGDAVIFLIDAIMVPTPPEGAVNNFYEGLAATKQLSTLKSVVDMYPDIVALLSSEDFIGSCFTPVNKAFEAVDTSGLTKDQIKNVLAYHCTDEKVLRGYDFASNETVKMLNGKTVALSRVDGINLVNGVRAAVTVPAGLGTVFIIPEVLLPK